jgi:hypothetical protein
MPSDEQRVRTMAGWIGVEISRSRVRTPGKAGYGLYRVRAAAERHWHVPHPPVGSAGEWTAYAFTLGEIDRAVRDAIERGTPSAPGRMIVDWPSARPGAAWLALPVLTRWTSAYRGRRDLGKFQVPRGRNGEVRAPMTVGEAEALVTPAAVKPEYVAELDALAALLDAGLITMVHVEGCACVDPPAKMSAACVRATMPLRMMQRLDNAVFQAEHLERREHGLKARYAAKEARNAMETYSDGGA